MLISCLLSIAFWTTLKIKFHSDRNDKLTAETKMDCWQFKATPNYMRYETQWEKLYCFWQRFSKLHRKGRKGYIHLLMKLCEKNCVVQTGWQCKDLQSSLHVELLKMMQSLWSLQNKTLILQTDVKQLSTTGKIIVVLNRSTEPNQKISEDSTVMLLFFYLNQCVIFVNAYKFELWYKKVKI